MSEPTTSVVQIHGSGVRVYYKPPNIYSLISYYNIERSGNQISLKVDGSVSALLPDSYGTRFGYEFQVAAQLDDGEQVILYTKPNGVDNWSAGDYAGSATVYSYNSTTTCALKINFRATCDCDDGDWATVWYVYLTAPAADATVTFDLAGGTRTGGGELVQTVPIGGSATPPTCERTGYNFTGWTGDYTNVTEDRTITANWSLIEWVIKYDAGGGLNPPYNQGKPYGQPIQVSGPEGMIGPSCSILFQVNGGIPLPSKTVHKEFKIWYSWADGQYYDPGSYYYNESDTLMYAEWNPAKMGELPTPTRQNYVFAGWYLNPEFITPATPETEVTVNTYVYAKWETSPIHIMTSSGWQPWLPSGTTQSNIMNVYKMTSTGWQKTGKVYKMTSSGWQQLKGT